MSWPPKPSVTMNSRFTTLWLSPCPRFRGISLSGRFNSPKFNTPRTDLHLAYLPRRSCCDPWQSFSLSTIQSTLDVERILQFQKGEKLHEKSYEFTFHQLSYTFFSIWKYYTNSRGSLAFLLNIHRQTYHHLLPLLALGATNIHVQNWCQLLIKILLIQKLQQDLIFDVMLFYKQTKNNLPTKQLKEGEHI